MTIFCCFGVLLLGVDLGRGRIGELAVCGTGDKVKISGTVGRGLNAGGVGRGLVGGAGVVLWGSNEGEGVVGGRGRNVLRVGLVGRDLKYERN